ncbi:MAG: phenylalanine--tRNA ligase subunit beta, partial [Candidatus Saccharibacteria bacterium]|nr:phenylalanine--tRNA ligase subunit beta [Candidatus Saccharibacteria bacterium]
SRIIERGISMKVSLNLIKFYNEVDNCGVDPYTYGVDEILHRIGAQLGAVEDVTYFGKRFDGVVVAKVVSCEPHENSDHLSVCMIDAGGVSSELATDDSGLIQVVCGASNVRAGLTVAWIPPEATVPSTVDKDPFVLSAREIRGKVSNGMLASPAELGLSDNHDGILEIDEAEVGEELSRPGTEFKNLYGLDDVIIDCENKMFTHRPDCFGTLGVAREIAGIFGDAFTSPEWYQSKLSNDAEVSLELNVENQIPELVSRFMMQAVADVEVKQSPMWLQAYLCRVGMKSINNIVDYSNYFMMLTGQPTHAFDYDKVVELCGENPLFAPRLAKKGEKIALLNGKTIELNDQDMVITANDRPIALAGVMGGSETEVDNNTKNIVLECATFDMYRVRRMSMRHGLFTDAVTRYTKGQSPLQNDKVLAKLVDEIVRFAGSKVASQVFDLYDQSKVESQKSKVVETTSEFINSRLGSELSVDQIKTFLTNVEFGYDFDNDNIKIYPPFWRTDIEISEDIVEEIGRIYGYDNLPVVLPARSSKPASKNITREFKNSLRIKLKEAGANEVLTYSFVHGDLMRNTGMDSDKSAYHLRNAISPDLQYYRTALMPSVLAKVNSNIRQQAGSDDNEFAIYEIGKAHIKGEFEELEPSLPKQMQRLALVYSADVKAAKNYQGSAYYQAKKYLDLVTNNQATYLPLDTNEYPISAPFQLGRSAVVLVDEQVIGVVGEFSAKVRKSLKLPDFCAGFEIDTELLQKYLKKTVYSPLSIFPPTHQDITFEVNNEVTWEQVEQLIHAELAVAKAELKIDYTLSAQDIFKTDDSSSKRFSFRITFTHSEKTLKTEEVNKLLDQISKVLGENANAKRI